MRSTNHPNRVAKNRYADQYQNLLLLRKEKLHSFPTTYALQEKYYRHPAHWHQSYLFSDFLISSPIIQYHQLMYDRLQAPYYLNIAWQYPETVHLWQKHRFRHYRYYYMH